MNLNSVLHIHVYVIRFHESVHVLWVWLGRVPDVNRYIYKEESFFVCSFLMHLDPVRGSAAKLCIASSFVQGKIQDYLLIQNFDLRGTYEGTFLGDTSCFDSFISHWIEYIEFPR